MSDSSNRTGQTSLRRRRAPLVASGRVDPEATTDASGDQADPVPAPSFPPPPPTPAGLRDDDGSWMSPREAAEAAGVPLSTVRRWRKAGTIAERKEPGLGVQVFLPADRTARGDGASASTTTPTSELGVLVPLEVYQRSLAELILRLTDTTERAVRAEAEVEHLRQRLDESLRSS